MNTISIDTAVTRPSAGRPESTPSLDDLLRRVLAAIREWRRRVRGRAELARFDDRLLRDIGITRVEALYEIDKPFWRR